MFSLTGKVALVAGGSGHLGVPMCRGLAEQGAAVVIASRNLAHATEAAEEVRAALPDAQVSALPLDVGDEQAIDKVLAQTIERYGALHILVNATFASIGNRVDQLSAAELDRTLHTNLTGAFLLARGAAERMTRGGSIILVSSMYGVVSPDPRIYALPMNPNPIEYGVAKAGLIQMARYLAIDWGPRGIRVNALVPGPFPSPTVQAADPGFIQRLSAKVPLGRIGERDEIAGAVAFLASDEARISPARRSSWMEGGRRGRRDCCSLS